MICGPKMGNVIRKSRLAPDGLDGWNTILSYWVSAYFQVRTVSFNQGLADHF